MQSEQNFFTKEVKYACEENLFQIEQKQSQGEQKMFADENCSKLNRKLWKRDKKIAVSMNYHGLVRPSLALNVLIMVLFLAFHGLLWPFNVFYGKISILLALYRLFSRSKIQIHWSCFFWIICSMIHSLINLQELICTLW